MAKQKQSKPSPIARHERWLKSLGYVKLDPSDRFYPIGAQDILAIYQKDTTNGCNQIGLFADGGWDEADQNGDGYHHGEDYESLVNEVRS